MSLTKIGGAVGDIKKIGVVNSVADLELVSCTVIG
jgi:hypothetical protein